jgi:putative spermidine/putrescine transport system permease protein
MPLAAADRLLTRRVRSLFMVSPVMLFLFGAFVVPLSLALAVGFSDFTPRTMSASRVTFEHYDRFLSDYFYIRVLLRTFGIATAATLMAAVVAYPVAYHLYNLRSSRVRALLTCIVLLPLLLSIVVTTYSWQLMLGDRGLVNSVWLFVGGDKPLRVLRTDHGVALALAYIYLPFMMLNIYSALANIDHDVVRAARVMGASPLSVFIHMIFPLSLPGVFSGLFLVFALCAGAFITPLVIGGSQVVTAPVMIYNFALAQFDWPAAGALAGILLALMLTIVAVLNRLVRRHILAWLG